MSCVFQFIGWLSELFCNLGNGDGTIYVADVYSLIRLFEVFALFSWAAIHFLIAFKLGRLSDFVVTVQGKLGAGARLLSRYICWSFEPTSRPH